MWHWCQCKWHQMTQTKKVMNLISIVLISGMLWCHWQYYRNHMMEVVWHDQKSHVAPYFNCLPNAVGIMWHWCQYQQHQMTKKSCCISFQLSPFHCQHYWHLMMPLLVLIVWHVALILIRCSLNLSPMSLITPLYIHHHTPPCCICICRWCHSSLWWDPYLWEPSGGFWQYYLLYNILVPHVFCMHFSGFHSAPWHVGPSYRASDYQM